MAKFAFELLLYIERNDRMNKMLKLFKGENMRIENATFNIVYSRIPDVRKRFSDFEDKLSKYFAAPFEVLSIPDNAPEEIPRIIANSIYGHTQLHISLSNVQFITQFDNEYMENLDQCMGYLEERIKYIYDVFNTIADGDFLFAGLTTKIIFDDIDNDPIELINDKFIKFKSNIKPFDTVNRFTYILDDKYYINIEISNVRSYEGKLQLDRGSLSGLKEKEHNVAFLLDINDRYSFNFTENYKTNFDNIKKVINLTRDILENKVYGMINEGVLEL